jgi:hypothetical protein
VVPEAEVKALEPAAELADHLLDGVPAAAAALVHHAREPFLRVRRFHEELRHERPP